MGVDNYRWKPNWPEPTRAPGGCTYIHSEASSLTLPSPAFCFCCKAWWRAEGYHFIWSDTRFSCTEDIYSSMALMTSKQTIFLLLPELFVSTRSLVWPVNSVFAKEEVLAIISLQAYRETSVLSHRCFIVFMILPICLFFMISVPYLVLLKNYCTDGAWFKWGTSQKVLEPDEN